MVTSLPHGNFAPHDGFAAQGKVLPLRRALISVAEKDGLVPLGLALADAGVDIVSTGHTADQLEGAGVHVRRVEEITGFPESLDGRVKTLHPAVHAGILADRRIDEHRAELRELGIEPFDLVIVNLYPFSMTAESGASAEECIEQIDIGGPAMIRSAAKNFANVAVLTDPDQYEMVHEAIAGGGFTWLQRRELAARAFAHTAAYDVAIQAWFEEQLADEDDPDEPEQMPGQIGAVWSKETDLRYGENPHQVAALYVDEGAEEEGLAYADQLHGKQMSFNNYLDAEAAYRMAYDFRQPAAAIVKHTNPCGVAIGSDIAEAYRLAYECDPVSAYGGVVAVNQKVDVELAEQLRNVFTEVLIAPDYDEAALDILRDKRNLRVLEATAYPEMELVMRQISGGLLVQTPDELDADGDEPSNWQLVSGDEADAETLADLMFAWRIAKSAKSNAVVLAQGGATVGIGMGQVNRLDACRSAIHRAGERAAGSVAASDGFFPFGDGPQMLVDAGVRAIVQPGGSMRDEEAIEAAQEMGVTMYLTGARHFCH